MTTIGICSLCNDQSRAICLGCERCERCLKEQGHREGCLSRKRGPLADMSHLDDWP